MADFVKNALFHPSFRARAIYLPFLKIGCHRFLTYVLIHIHTRANQIAPTYLSTDLEEERLKGPGVAGGLPR